MNAAWDSEEERMATVYKHLGFRRLYRYFRSGGIYRYNPRSRRDAASLAWAYSRKERHARRRR